MPDQIIANVRRALEGARKALGPQSRQVLENALVRSGQKSTIKAHRAGMLKALEEFDGLDVKVDPAVYVLLAVEQLTDLVEEMANP